MIGKMIIALGFALLAIGGAAAADIDGVTLSDDKRTALFAQGSGIYIAPPQHEPRTKTIFSNIGVKYPKGEYFCCFGDTISGAQSIVNAQSWVAAQFASADDVTITEIDVAAEWASGTNEIDIGLYTDKDGIPGRLLKKFQVTGLQGISGCCGLAVAKDKMGIAIAGGRPYWIAVTTGSSDTFAVWADNTTDEIYGVPIAVNSGTGWQAGGYQIPQLSFGVYGQ
jgi:hypothetical protein